MVRRRRASSLIVQKLMRIGWADRWAIAKATILLVAARLALRLLPLRRVLLFASLSDEPQMHLSGAAPPATSRKSIAENPDLQRLVWAVDVVGRRLFPANPCLTQAIVVQRALRRSGYPSELRIGVKKVGEATLQAHAWVENHDELIIGGQGLDPDYQPFPDVLGATAPLRSPGHSDE